MSRTFFNVHCLKERDEQEFWLYQLYVQFNKDDSCGMHHKYSLSCVNVNLTLMHWTLLSQIILRTKGASTCTFHMMREKSQYQNVMLNGLHYRLFKISEFELTTVLSAGCKYCRSDDFKSTDQMELWKAHQIPTNQYSATHSRAQTECDGTWKRTGGEVKGKKANGGGSQQSCTVSDTVYPALLPLMHTPRLPAAEWTDTPANINGLVRFAGKPNLVSARVPSRSVSALQLRNLLLVPVSATERTNIGPSYAL